MWQSKMLTDFDETLGSNFFHCILLPKKFPVKLKKFPGEGTPYWSWICGECRISLEEDEYMDKLRDDLSR